MKRSTRFILGLSVALVTAASLHLTVGHRFHQRAFAHHRYGCGVNTGPDWNYFNEKPAKPAPEDQKLD